MFIHTELMHYTEEFLTIPSRHLDRDVRVQFLMPEDYSSLEQLGLLLLNDGQDMDALRMKETLEVLAEAGKISPIVVVGIHAGERLQEYGTAGIPDVKKRGSLAKEYTDFVVTELLPAIHDTTGIAAFTNTAIAGCSLGALSAMDIAWHHQAYFDIVGSFSGSFWWRNVPLGKRYSDDKNRIMHQIIRQDNAKPALKFWFQTGTMDETADRNNNGIIDAVDDTTDLIFELLKKGYQRPDDICYLEVVGGRHNQETWSRAMPRFLEWAFGSPIF